MDTAHLMPSARTLPLVDALLALWVISWIALGVAIGINVSNLTGLSHTVATEGQAVETVGRSLHSLGGVPFVGGEISRAAEQVQRAGASAVASGRSSASSIEALSVLLAAIFLVLAIYLRALVAPGYLILTSLLAVLSALGLTVYVMQDLLGYGQTILVPALVVLVGPRSAWPRTLPGEQAPEHVGGPVAQP